MTPKRGFDMFCTFFFFLPAFGGNTALWTFVFWKYILLSCCFESHGCRRFKMSSLFIEELLLVAHSSLLVKNRPVCRKKSPRVNRWSAVTSACLWFLKRHKRDGNCFLYSDLVTAHVRRWCILRWLLGRGTVAKKIKINISPMQHLQHVIRQK